LTERHTTVQFGSRRYVAGPQLARSSADDLKLLVQSFDIAGKALGQLVVRAAMIDMTDEARFLSTYLLLVTDARLRQRAAELIRDGKSLAQALGQVAREAGRAANGAAGNEFLQERARDIEDFCDALLMLASPDARAELPTKAVLLGDRLSVFDLLVSIRAQPVGIALTEQAPRQRTDVLLRLMNVPSIIDVHGAYKWVSPGDVALLDADHGFLIINPSRTEVAALRAARKKGRHPKDGAASDAFPTARGSSPPSTSSRPPSGRGDMRARAAPRSRPDLAASRPSGSASGTGACRRRCNRSCC
jgi:phosphotransferase system enzyme I (PtsP)